jgi:hypothetical protein
MMEAAYFFVIHPTRHKVSAKTAITKNKSDILMESGQGMISLGRLRKVKFSLF